MTVSTEDVTQESWLGVEVMFLIVSRRPPLSRPHRRSVLRFSRSPCDVKIAEVTVFIFPHRLLFGTNHLFVLHHPKDSELLRKQEEAKKEGRVLEDIVMSYDKAQEEIAKHSGLLSSGMFDFDGVGGREEKSFQMDMLLREDLLKVLPMISEANAMSEELDKKV